MASDAPPPPGKGGTRTKKKPCTLTPNACPHISCGGCRCTGGPTKETLAQKLWTSTSALANRKYHKANAALYMDRVLLNEGSLPVVAAPPLSRWRSLDRDLPCGQCPKCGAPVGTTTADVLYKNPRPDSGVDASCGQGGAQRETPTRSRGCLVDGHTPKVGACAVAAAQRRHREHEQLVVC